MTSWPDLLAALQARAGWRRVGREYHGPCPVSGAGSDGCFASEGRRAAVVLGCRKCASGGKLDGEAFRQHLEALVGATTREVVAPGPPNAGRRIANPSDLPVRVWRASVAPEGTPGAAYLTRRGCWPAGERLPASVGWLPSEAALRVDCRPSLPRGAAGVIVYLFQAPGSADVGAAQLEAVDAHGARLTFYGEAKRVGVTGCTFDGGRRVFAAGGDPDRGVHLCEGPLDTLALMHLARLGTVELAAAAVHGAAGVSGFTARACPGRAAVTIWRHRDTQGHGQRAAARLAGELRRTDRRVTIRGAPWDGADLTDWVRAVLDDRAEREAIQHES